MLHLITGWLTIVTIGLLAVMSPGPNLAVTIRNSLLHSRKAGVYTATGLAAGNLVHATYCLVGIGVIITQSILLFNTIKWLGAGFLIFMAYKSLKARPYSAEERAVGSTARLSPAAAFRTGFFTNLLNPKVTLFFLALFTQMIEPGTPLPVQSLYGATMVSLEFGWFAVVSVLISQEGIKKRFFRISHWLERLTGVVLMGLGIRLAFADRH